MRKICAFCLALLLLVMMGGCADMLISDEFRAIMEQETLSVEEIWEIEDAYDFVSELSMYIAEKCAYGSNLDALSEQERVFYIAQTLEMEVNNGGFWQFFFNTDSAVFSETESALQEIGAAKTAQLYREAVAAFDQEMPAGRAQRMKMLNKVGMEECYEILSEFDDAFYAYEEDLTALLYAYAQSNRDAFS